MKQLFVLMVGCALALASPAVAQQFDLVILNGRVLDPESGLDAQRTIGIREGRIAAIQPGPLKGRRTIDAKGLVIAPGFIDLHRHGQNDENYRYAALDGVTTALELEVGVGDVERWYREREPGRLVHYGAAIGHIPVRMAVLGDSGTFLPSGPAADQRATGEQVQEMARRIDQGLRQGAVGVGFGTAYTPAASRWEVLEMFRVAARHRAPAYIHVRNGIVGVQEAIANAVVAGAPLHIVHLNSTSGDDIGRMLGLIAEAQGRGLDLTTEAYPYTAGATRIESALYDGWEERPDEWFHAFEWPETGERLTRETFARYRQTGGTVIRHGNSEENVAAAIGSPLTMIASDGGLRGGKGHPRGTGAYSKVLGRYVREAGALSLMDAIRKMTLMPARRLEGRIPAMKDRGRIRVGADADLVLFDAARVIDRSSYREPALAPEGILHVLVAGVPVVADGRIVEGVAPGRPVRAPF